MHHYANVCEKSSKVYNPFGIDNNILVNTNENIPEQLELLAVL